MHLPDPRQRSPPEHHHLRHHHLRFLAASSDRVQRSTGRDAVREMRSAGRRDPRHPVEHRWPGRAPAPVPFVNRPPPRPAARRSSQRQRPSPPQQILPTLHWQGSTPPVQRRHFHRLAEHHLQLLGGERRHSAVPVPWPSPALEPAPPGAGARRSLLDYHLYPALRSPRHPAAHPAGSGRPSGLPPRCLADDELHGKCHLRCHAPLLRTPSPHWQGPGHWKSPRHHRVGPVLRRSRRWHYEHPRGPEHLAGRFRPQQYDPATTAGHRQFRQSAAIVEPHPRGVDRPLPD